MFNMQPTQNINVIEAVIANMTDTIAGEVSNLRDDAESRIGAREAARRFINTHLDQFPKLVEGDMIIAYKDDRQQEQTKQQSKNLALWTVALQTSIEAGYTSYAIMTTVFTEWALATTGVTWSQEAAEPVARKYVEAMRELFIFSKELTEHEYTTSDGVAAVTRVVLLTDSFQEVLDKLIVSLRESAHMKCMPLANQPEDWTSMTDGVAERAGLQLVTGAKSDLFVGKKVLSAVNKLQAVKFVVAPAIVSAAYNILDNVHLYLTDELTEAEYRKREDAVRVMRAIRNMGNEQEFFFAITMDKRGRMYYRGGLTSPQGTDFCKAAFQFANGMPLGETGYKALCLHTANVFGKDKLSINNRMEWVRYNTARLLMINTHYDVQETFAGADTFQALVAAKELQRLQVWEDAGNATEDFVSTLVCHQDGTCNGLQHMAAITHNRSTAEAVNCTASTHDDVPTDIYGVVANKAADISTGIVKDAIEAYGRSMAKNPVMITGYGAGDETIVVNTAAYLTEKGKDATLGRDCGNAYLDSIKLVAPAVSNLTNALKARAKVAIQKGHSNIRWVTQDGFIVDIEYRDIECNRVRAGAFNAMVPSMRPAPLDEVKTAGALPPNFIHSIDANHLRLVTNECDHELVTVHDSIGSHAATYFETARVVRSQFANVHEYDALDSLCANLDAPKPEFIGDYDASEALESSYIFS